MNAPASHFIEALGNTLLHSLWQGSLIAFLLAVFLATARKAPSSVRYQVSCLALFALPFWIAVTFAAEWQGHPGPLPGKPDAEIHVRSINIGAATLPIPPSIQPSPDWQSWAAAGWFLGVAFFVARLSGGWFRLNRLRRSAAGVTEIRVQRILAETCDRLRIRYRVQILVSDRIEGPIMTGFFWPAIILPAGMLGGIPAVHLQSILAHELAHFRRWDYLVNLVQSLADAFLFYHPAAWWISRQIRVEREFACDDLAATIPGNDPARYAGTLAWLETFRTRTESPELALGMVSDRLNTLARIARLFSHYRLGKESTQEGSPPRFTGWIWILTGLSAVVFASAAPGDSGNSGGTSRLDSNDPESSVFSRCHEGIRRTEQSARLLTQTIPWPARIYRGYEAPLLRSVVIVEKSGKLYNLLRERPRLFPEFPNHYLLDHQLNFLDGKLPIRDPDGDGFNTLEEYRTGTRPNDALSHPDIAAKLKFLGRHVQLYRVTFAAQLDDVRIQLNRLPTARWTRETMVHQIGEISEDGQLRLDSLNGTDLEVTFVASGTKFLLPKRRPVEIPTWFAEMQLGLDGEKPFIVELGSIFHLNREPGRSWKLVSVEKTGARIREIGTDETRTIGVLSESVD